MTKKDISETHPSLYDIFFGELDKERIQDAIQQHTIDKQVLKEKIQKLRKKFFIKMNDGSMNTKNTGTLDALQNIDEFIEELGLDEE